MDASGLREAFIAVALGAAFLYAFFRAVQTQWPASYFGATDTTSYAITRSPFRYTAYRLGPLFVVCLFIAVTLERRDGYALGAALSLSVTHAASTNGYALVESSRRAGLRRHRIPVSLVKAFVLVGLLVIGYSAYLTRGVLESVVPPLSEMTAALWTALLAGIAGAYIGRLSEHGGASSSELVEKSRAEVPAHLRELMASEAASAGVDPWLGLAVMAVENLQRPPWFRRLEKLKAKISGPGTYGIMQVRADNWIDDEESIRRAVAGPLKGVVIPSSELYEEQVNALRDFALAYNPDPTYVELLQDAYANEELRALKAEY
jgi:hypothetical protein